METLLALLVIREGNPPVTSGPHRKGPVIFSMICEKAVDQTDEMYMTWDTTKLMSRYHNGGWAEIIWSILKLDMQISPGIAL